MILVPWPHYATRKLRNVLYYSRTNYVLLKVPALVSEEEEKNGHWRKQLTVAPTLVGMIVPWSEPVRADGILVIPEFHHFILKTSKLSSREVIVYMRDCMVNPWQCPSRTQISVFQVVQCTFCRIHFHSNKWRGAFKNPLLERHYLSLYIKASSSHFLFCIG